MYKCKRNKTINKRHILFICNKEVVFIRTRVIMNTKRTRQGTFAPCRCFCLCRFIGCTYLYFFLFHLPFFKFSFAFFRFKEGLDIR